MKLTPTLLFVIACGGVESPDPIQDSSPKEAGPTDVFVPHEAAVIDAPVESGVGLPIPLASAVLWLDASVGVTLDTGDRVLVWTDRSPFSNNANGAAEYAPTFVPGAMGKFPALHFSFATNAQYLAIADSSSMQWGTGDFLVAVLARFTNATSGGLEKGTANLFWKSTFTSQKGAGVALWGNIPLSNGSVEPGFALLEDENDYATDTTAYNDGTTRLFIARRASGSLELRVNGGVTSTQTESAPVDVSAPFVEAVIGSIQTYYDLDGDIAEVVACRGTTPLADVAALEAYFETKYAL